MSGTFRALSQGPRSKHHFRALEAKCYSPKGRRGLPVLRLIDARRRRALRVAHPCASASLVTPMPRPVNQCPSSRQHWALLRLWRSAACTMSHAWSLGRLGCVAPPPGQMQWNGEIRAHTRVQPSEPLKRHSSTLNAGTGCSARCMAAARARLRLSCDELLLPFAVDLRLRPLAPAPAAPPPCAPPPKTEPWPDHGLAPM